MLLLAALGILTSLQAPLPADFPTKEDAEEIAEILRCQSAYGDEIWPGFGKAAIPILLYDDKFDYLIGHPKPPPEFELAPTSPRRIFRRAATKHSAFAVKVGEVWCGSMATYGQMRKSVPLDRGFHLEAALHEMFHAFQAREAPERFAAALAVYKIEGSYPDKDAGFNAAWKEEGALLANALESKTDEEARAAALQFLQHRAKRRKSAALSQELIEFEVQLEWLEGLGKYAESRISVLAASDPKVPARYGGSSSRRAAEMIQLRSALGIARGDTRFYASGMAQAKLLDRLCPGWKKAGLGEVRLAVRLREGLGGISRSH